MRGFVREMISVITWVLAVWLAIFYGSDLANQLSGLISNPTGRVVFSFIVILAAVVIVGGILNLFISRAITGTGLSPINRIIGAVFGIARGLIIVALIIMLIDVTALNQKPSWQESYLVPQVQSVADWMHGGFEKHVRPLIKKSNSAFFEDETSTVHGNQTSGEVEQI